MKGIVDILEQLEKLMYKILMWIILIPKTIVWITIHPERIQEYIKQELGEGKSRFDEYMSPMVLFLVVALIPAVVVTILPSYGVTLDSPSINEPSASRHLDFNAKSVFKSTDTNGYYEFIWTIYKIDENGDLVSPAINQIRHTNNFNKFDTPGYEFVFFNTANANTVQDAWDYNFGAVGDYVVFIDAFKLDAKGNTIDYAYNDISVYIPQDFAENVYVSVYNPKNPVKPGESTSGIEKLSGQLKAESTYLIALGLLILPMAFTLAIKLFSSETVSEDMLREAFYAQCYYFTPLSLAFWATFYSITYTTSDIFFYNDTATLILFLPPILAFVWFVVVETGAIAEGRRISKWKAFLIAFVCIVMLLVGGLILADVVSDLQYQDYARQNMIRLYPIAALGLLIFFGIEWYKGIKAENKKPSFGNWAAILGFAAIIVLSIVVIVSGKSPPVSPDDFIADIPEATEPPAPVVQEVPTIAVMATALAPANTPQPESRPYYTEYFSESLDGWNSFMASGLDSQANIGFNNGQLEIQLSPFEDKIPWFYLVNNAFTYSDVQLDVVTTNLGNNANGVSLICRYGNSGWYEFRVSNTGLYSIFAVDVTGAIQEGYNEIGNGGSSAIKTGLATNAYTAICEGNELTLYVNDVPVNTVSEMKFNFMDGVVGIAVSSPQTLPVDVSIASLTVSEP